ncbi:MAG: protein TolQ [Alphaproteobacteria bacterium]|nr:protein TolQ [Alphaproteobacteria bacterium]
MPAGSVTTAVASLSMWGLFLQADFVVKTVIIILAMASIWSWAIIFEKIMLLRSATEDAKKFEAQFWSGGSLDEMFDKLEAKPFRLDPMSAVFVAAMREWRRSSGTLGMGGVHGTSLNQRIDRVMQVTMDREMDRLEKRMTFLASTGAVYPFIGLFGTVWGIMNSFHNIGSSSNTSLAVVAPGIAEALFATALGLTAAIPAVLAYNKLSSDMNRYAKTLENFAGEFSTILSRQIDDTAYRSEKRSG